MSESITREAPNAAAMGTKAYKERIHRDSKYLDNNKDLPFKFSKLKKSKANNVYFVCPECGKDIFITEDTVMVICDNCKKLSRTKPPKKD
jgi:predicted RNA-binding Zn-ribbon protein involved in translation (DUF1610 family)